MKAFKKLLAGVAALSLALSFVGPIPVFAATTPSLGAAATYGVLSSTYVNTNVPLPTTINGDVGFSAVGAPAVTPLPLLLHPSGTYPNYGVGGNFSAAGIAQASALVNLNNQPCTFTFVAPAVVLDTTLEHLTTYTPGVYCSTGAMSVGTAGGITLSGTGTYIFRSGGALNTVAGSTVNLAGASACDVFWTPNGDTTLNANSTFVGTVIPVSQDITVYSTTNWTGRALTFGHTVTTPDANVVITVPTCALPPSGGSASTGFINVTKVVVNDGGGTNTVADFPLFVNGLFIASGVTNIFGTNSSQSFQYNVTETSNANYTTTFSGDCNASGQVFLDPNETLFCIVTNNDINAPVIPVVPPLIDVVKVPSPLSLPAGPGSVLYTYTTRNIGTVPMSNVTMVGDSCSPIVLASGDTNNNSILEVNETWVYTCTTNLTATHTNTVVATGWANGISAIDIASATVIVGLPIVPPLIHITKVPSPLSLGVGGGLVTYTKTVTNPGTVALSNVQVTDDKCSPVSYISGDTDVDALLDASETWIYRCTTNLTATTTNTAVATGVANGLTARDFAVATVVVPIAVPALPNTGVAPVAKTVAGGILTISLILYASYAIRKRQRVSGR